MKIKVPSKKKSLIILLVLTTLIITILVIVIFALQRVETNKTNKSTDTITEFTEIKNEIINISSQDYDNNNETYDRMRTQIAIVEDNTKSQQEKYDALQSLELFLKSEYSRTNNPKYYVLLKNKVKPYVKENYPDLYDESVFYTSCQHEECADDEQPVELQEILNLIKESDLPDVVKETLIQDLINTGYKSDKTELEGKVGQYVLLADMVSNLDEMSESGANDEIGEMIIKLVENNYPEEYKKIEFGDGN